MNKIKMRTTDLAQENFEYLATRFPECVVETIDENGDSKKSIDFDMLKQQLSSVIADETKERYQMTWPNKKNAIVEANQSTNKTLRPDRDSSVNFDTTKNIYIEGDNIDALKILRQSYLNGIDCIYIDPPYNTGTDKFIYTDDYSLSDEEFLAAGGYIDEDGTRFLSIKDNNMSDGRFHTKWLNMMYARIKLARDLLKNNGSIFISIDDNEIANLKKICDELFGESNFVALFTWMKTTNPPSLGSKIRDNMEYILCYEKLFNSKIKLYGRESNQKDSPLANGSNKENIVTIPSGTCRFTSLQHGIISNGIKESGVELLDSIEVNDEKNVNDFKVKFKSKWGQENIYEEVKNGTFFIIKDHNYFSIRYQKGNIDYVVPDKYLDLSKFDVKDNEFGRKEVENLLGPVDFDYPKNTPLIKTLIKMYMKTEPNGIILDFFSGSATTADAVMQLNAEDGGNRKFIMVQYPEMCDEKSDAYKLGYKNICEIGSERIRRAGNLIKDKRLSSSIIDTGFRYFKITSTNMKEIYYKPSDIEQSLLDLTVDNIKSDRNAEDLLFQVMISYGVDLTEEIKKIEINGHEVYFVGESLCACFDNDVDDNTITEIAKLKPTNAVFRESCFKNDSSKINLKEIFKRLSPSTKKIEVL